MPNDRIGHAVALGEVYVVAGEVRVMSGSDVVVVAGKVPHHVDAADVVRLDDLLGFQVDLQRNLIGSTGVTSIAMEVGNLLRHPTAGVETPVRRGFRAKGAAVNLKHGTAGGPWTGWSLNLYKNGSTTASATLSISVANGGFANNVSHGNLSSAVSFAPGDRWWTDLTGGTALDNPIVAAVLYGEFDAAP